MMRNQEAHDPCAGAWRVLRARPRQALLGGVAPYRGIEVAFGGPRSRLEMPTGLATLVFGFGDPLRIFPAVGGGRADAVQAASIVSVPHTNAHMGTHTGNVRALEVTLTPPAAARVLGVPLTEFTRPIHALADVMGADAALLLEQLTEAADWAQRFALLDRFLARRLDEAPPCPPAVAWLWRRLNAVPGPRVRELCAELEWSERQLRRRFTQHVGITPKQVAVVARLQRALRLEATGVALADIAHAAGYHDHAHMDHSFTALTGLTPSAYRARRQASGTPDLLADRVPARVTGLPLTP